MVFVEGFLMAFEVLILIAFDGFSFGFYLGVFQFLCGFMLVCLIRVSFKKVFYRSASMGGVKEGLYVACDFSSGFLGLYNSFNRGDGFLGAYGAFTWHSYCLCPVPHQTSSR